METLRDKVAVVTGAASGIGLGMVEAFGAAGMKIVMADIEMEVLAREAARLADAGVEVAAERVDVADFASVALLAQAARERFGAVHVLCNNAGVAGADGGRPIWLHAQEEWDWVMGVNFRGVVNGLRAFVPDMIASGAPGHIVNTASILGLTSGHGSIYGVSKHAVARLTEGLYHDLQAADAKIGVTLLCPGLIATNILSSVRNRPAALKTDAPAPDPDRRAALETFFKTQGMAPRAVGDRVVDAILKDKFYVLTHEETMAGVQRRFDDIVNLRRPTPPPQRRNAS
jgi:NAD(P)-dependent dehydrogenase (short-subunit alcohol dehydrogenase family)